MSESAPSKTALPTSAVSLPSGPSDPSVFTPATSSSATPRSPSDCAPSPAPWIGLSPAPSSFPSGSGSPPTKPSTIRHSSNARSSGARSRPAVFTRRDYIVVATDRTNDLKIRWVHSPHLCRTLAHRVVRVGRLLQTLLNVSGVVCHRNYCPGLLTHGYGHPSIGNYRYIQPQDYRRRLIRR